MQNDKDIRFKQAWWLSLSSMTSGMRDEIFCAICSYAFDQQEPEFTSELARGIFTQMRADIDIEREHAEQVRESRRQAGKIGGQRSSEVRWGTCKQSKQMLTGKQNKQMLTENTENEAKPSANADTCKQSKQMLTISPDPSINNIYNYILSLTQTRTPAYEKVVSWLTDDEEKLQMLFYRSGIITEALQGEELAKIAAPYIEAYFNAMEFATDWEMKGRRDTKAHFNNWLRTHKVLNDGKQESTVHANTGRSTPKTNKRATPDYDAEF